MTKKQRISRCLNELQDSHGSRWPDITAIYRITLGGLKTKGYICRKEGETPSGNTTYELTEEGKKFVAENPVYLRPSLKEILHQQIAVVRYLGKRIRVFNDDSGQQCYFYYEGNCVGCGSYNANYADFIKWYLDDKINFICLIDTPEYPLMKATLEYRKNKTGRTVKCLALTDREEGLFKEPFRVGKKHTKNETCVKTARYIISIIKRQGEINRAHDKDADTTEDLR